MSKVFQRGFDINDKKWFSNKEIISTKCCLIKTVKI